MTSIQTFPPRIRSLGILGIAAVLVLALVVPSAAQARTRVTRSEVSTAVMNLANQSASGLESNSVAGVNLGQGTVEIDRSRTGVSNYQRYGRYRMRASFALFGTHTVAGVARTMWCLGQADVIHTRPGGTRFVLYLTCPVS